MPVVRGLEKFLRDSNLVKAGTTDVLKGATVGFDGVQWFKNSEAAEEPLAVALGGIHLALEQSVDLRLNALSKAGVNPVFVFGGIIPPKQTSVQPRAASKFQSKTHEAWQAYEDGQSRTAAHLFQQVGGYVSLDVQAAICRVFDKRGVRYFRAPFSSAAQLSWLSMPPQNFVHAVYGGLDLLLFGVQRVVIELSADANRVEWVDLAECLDKLKLSYRQFVDMCLLAGYGRCRTHPLVVDARQQFSFDLAYRLLKDSHDALTVVRANKDVVDEDYVAELLRTRMLVTNHVVLKAGLNLSPLLPVDKAWTGELTLPDVFGPSFPSDVYVLVVKGVLSSQILNTLVNGALIDSAPVVDSQEYVQFLDGLTPLRRRTFSLLASVLPEHARNTRVVNKRWYDPVDETVLYRADASLPPLDTGDLSNAWKIQGQALAEECKRQQLDAAQLPAHSSFFALRWLAARPQLEGALTNGELNATDEVSMSVMYQLLQHTGYVTSAHSLTPMGKAAAQCSHIHCDDALFFATQLLGQAQLHGRALSLLDPDGKVFFASVQEPREVRLLSRVCSLVPMTLRAGVWTGPIDRELAAFHALVKGVQRAARNLVETLVLVAFLRQEVARPSGSPDDTSDKYMELSYRLPFAHEPGTGMGSLVKELLAGSALDAVRQRFPQATNIESDLAVAFLFWDQVVGVVRTGGLSIEVVQEFANADMFLRNALKGTPFEKSKRSTVVPVNYRQLRDASINAVPMKQKRTTDAPGANAHIPTAASTSQTGMHSAGVSRQGAEQRGAIDEKVEKESNFNDSRYWRSDHSYLNLADEINGPDVEDVQSSQQRKQGDADGGDDDSDDSNSETGDHPAMEDAAADRRRVTSPANVPADFNDIHFWTSEPNYIAAEKLDDNI